MSNVTPQIALNKGYTVLSQTEVTANSPGAQIPAVAGTNKIIIISNQNSVQVYLGNSNVTNADGLPIMAVYSTYDGTSLATFYVPLPIEIITDTPEDFYLYSNAPGGIVRVLYLALNT